jgi:excinuclease ABC subunit A
MNSSIKIKGARVNNLKNIDVEIPRNKLVVVTGLSGSGKSSLAFDTLYAEGQRRYVESLSSYARQFLGRMGKPECDFIKGIPPAIAIEQKVTSRNPRSTVGTSTEIYDFLRLLYARIGKTISPISGTEVKKHTAEDVLEAIQKYPKDTKFTVLTPFVIPEGRSIETQLEMSLKQGFSRIDIDGEIIQIEDFLKSGELGTDKKILTLVDRMKVDDAKDVVSRMADSVETAFYEGNGTCYIRIYPEKELLEFSNKFEADGMAFEEPTDQTFSFNSPLGACPECEGFGKIIGIDPALVIPNSALSVYEGAVVCWRGEKMVEWKNEFCRRAEKVNFPIFKPYYQLTDQERDWLWHGLPGEESLPEYERVSIDNFFKMLQ